MCDDAAIQRRVSSSSVADCSAGSRTVAVNDGSCPNSLRAVECRMSVEAASVNRTVFANSTVTQLCDRLTSSHVIFFNRYSAAWCCDHERQTVCLRRCGVRSCLRRSRSSVRSLWPRIDDWRRGRQLRTVLVCLCWWGLREFPGRGDVGPRSSLACYRRKASSGSNAVLRFHIQ